MPSSSARARPAGRSPPPSPRRPPDRPGRAGARRRHLHQRGLHPDQDDGRERAGRLPGAAGRGLRRARPARSGSICPGAGAQARHRRELPRRQRAADPRRRRAWSSSTARRASPGPATVAMDGPELRGRPGLHQHRRPPGRSGGRGSRSGRRPRLHVDHGAGPRARAPAGAGRRLHRARVRPDVPPLRQPGDGGPAGRAAAAARGRGRAGGGAATILREDGIEVAAREPRRGAPSPRTDGVRLVHRSPAGERT